MQLEEFAGKVSEAFNEDCALEVRKDFSTHIAQKYGFPNPSLVLFFTHPTLAKLPLQTRCKRLGMTEEQFHYGVSHPGFKQFLKDYEINTLSALRTQAMDKVSRAIQETRITYDKNGNSQEDFSIEMSLLSNSPYSKPDTTQANVNLQVNLFDEARAQLKSANPEDV